MSPSRILPVHLAVARRSFVSTVLLSRTWENETVVELCKEAKARGLSTKGNKPTLVARIQEHEKNSMTRTIRGASTSVVPPASSPKTSQATSPGILPAAQRYSESRNTDFLATKLPSLSRPPPNAPVQIPYVPDFWNSARPKADTPLELEPPKLHVVSESVTHHAGGPAHTLEGITPPNVVRSDNPSAGEVIGFWADFWESLGFPRSFSIRRTLSEAGNSATESDKSEARTRSRPLTDEERRGLYILFTILGGSWLAGGLINQSAVVVEEHGTQNQY